MQTYVREQAEILRRHSLRLSLPPHLIIAPLHQVPLQLNRILDIRVILNTLSIQTSLLNQSLQHGMEVSAITRTQQQQQIQPCYFAPLAGAKVHVPCTLSGRRRMSLQIIERLQLLVVSRERICVGLSD